MGLSALCGGWAMRFSGAMELGHDALGLIRLTESQCWAFLRRHSLGRLAFVSLDNPDIFPVNYATDGRSVVFRTAPGTKLAHARRGTPAAFEVDEATHMFESGTSVVVHGVLEEVTDKDELRFLAALPLRAWAPGRRDHFVRLRTQWVSGRRLPIGDPVSAQRDVG